MMRMLLLVLVLLSSSCTLLLARSTGGGQDGAPDTSAVDAEVEAEALPDGDDLDADAAESVEDAEAIPADVGPEDAAPPEDAALEVSPDGSSDADSPEPVECVKDTTAVAFWGFDGTDEAVALSDRAGEHDPVELQGGAALGRDHGDCGYLHLNSSEQSYGQIPDDEDWDDDVGSIDFWFRVKALPTKNAAGLISRDDSGSKKAGHLSVLLNKVGRIGLRLQDEAGEEFGESFRCSTSSIPLERWTHVVIDLGPEGGSEDALEMFVDGAPANHVGDLEFPLTDTYPFTIHCGRSNADPVIGANKRPWLLGAHNMFDDPRGFIDGDIDRFRISAARRGSGFD